MSIPSSPATFTLSGTASNAGQGVTFAIPAGVYTAAVWTLDDTEYWNPLTSSGGGGRIYTTATAITGHNVDFAVHAAPGGTYTGLTKAANAQQITDINAAAGGNLSGLFKSQAFLNNAFGGNPPESIAVSALTLTLTGGPVSGRRSSSTVIF